MTRRFLFHRIRLVLAGIALSLFAVSCGGDDGGGGAPAPPSNNVGGGWVTIEYPTTQSTYSTQFDGVTLGGSAFISPTWWSCCSGTAEELTGVTVSVRNSTTGLSVSAHQSVSFCPFFGLCGHDWWAISYLAVGTNTLIVEATDKSGRLGRAILTVSRGPDTTPPSVSSINPANNATGVGTNTVINVTFDEPINTSTLTSSTFLVQDANNNIVPGTVSSYLVSSGDTVATFRPTGNLAYDTRHTVTLTTGMTDLAGNALSVPYSWSFTTGPAPDTTPPEVTSTNPTSNAIDVPYNGALTATFSESMDAGSLTNSTFQLKDGSNNPVPGTVSLTGTMATFRPNAALAFTSQYTATITTGVRDLAGNALASPYVWAFTTGTNPDPTPPTVTSTSPAPDETFVAVDRSIGAVFSEAIDGSTITNSTFFVRDAASNPVSGSLSFSSLGASFRPSQPLAFNTSYTATLTAGIRDLAGNPLVSPYSWSFTTGPEGTGSWRSTSTVNAPPAREEHNAVWTGSEMIIWGGRNGSTPLNSGGRYSPQTDSWLPISTVNAPAAGYGHVAVWTGSEMIIWKGSASQGARYNPSTDTWQPISSTNAPIGRNYATAAWTGSEMIVWGGFIPTGGGGGHYENTGGRYNPVTDTWHPTTLTNAPQGRFRHSAIWTGTHMIVWGGAGLYYVRVADTGGKYDPVNDVWLPISQTNAPWMSQHAAVWTGLEMILWHGTGARYTPLTDLWQATSGIGQPASREFPGSVWTGTQMIVWGGEGLNTGGKYAPSTDTWESTKTAGSPSGRTNHTSIWTGAEMIIWGGNDGSATYTGGRYVP